MINRSFVKRFAAASGSLLFVLTSGGWAADSLYQEAALSLNPAAHFDFSTVRQDHSFQNMVETDGAPSTNQLSARFRDGLTGIANAPGPRPSKSGLEEWAGFSLNNACGRFGAAQGRPAPLLEIPAHKELDFAAGEPDAFTVSFWLRCSTSQPDGTTIVYRGAGTNVQFAIMFDKGVLVFRSDRADGAVRVTPPPARKPQQSLGDDRWHHAVAILRSTGRTEDANGSMEVYVDGVRQSKAGTRNQGYVSVIPSHEPIFVGGRPQPRMEKPFDGWIDEVTFYRRALEPNEVKVLFDAASRPPERTVIILGAIREWPCRLNLMASKRSS